MHERIEGMMGYRVKGGIIFSFLRVPSALRLLGPGDFDGSVDGCIIQL